MGTVQAQKIRSACAKALLGLHRDYRKRFVPFYGTPSK